MRLWRGLLQVGSTIVNSYVDDRVPRMAAALSYYTVFSLAPLLVIVIAVAGLIYGHEAASGGIANQMRTLLGDTGAQAIQSMVANAWHHGSSLFASLLGLLTLLLGATGVFGELQDSLNTIWGVDTKPGHGVWNFVRSRMLSFTMILVIGFLMLVSLTFSAAVAAVGAWLSHTWPSLAGLVRWSNLALLFGISSLLFALIFKILPDVELRWRDVWIGAGVTAGFFGLGRWAIGLYLGHSAIASSYGAVGSLAVLLIWVYFSAQAFLIGAEFTKGMTRTFGPQPVPKPIAQFVGANGPNAATAPTGAHPAGNAAAP